MKVLIIDNFDSFTFNLYQAVGDILDGFETEGRVEVFRNNEITIDAITSRSYDRIIISPGPGTPEDEAYFGVCTDVIAKLGSSIPLLGVCLGFQGIIHYFGGKIIKAKVPMHGKVSIIQHEGEGVFKDLPDKIEVMRYHSLIADTSCIPDCLEITATIPGKTKDECEIMGVRHREFPIEGVQFHPESFATEGGIKMLETFLVRS